MSALAVRTVLCGAAVCKDRADGHLMLENIGETAPGLVAWSWQEQHESRKEDDGRHRLVSCRRCLNSRERCSVLHLLLEKSKMCSVLCQEKARCPGWQSWAGL